MVTVVAHRGASADRAEHTLAAYRRAVEVGADALECDIRLTADGVLVCVHDRRVDRTSQRPRRRLGPGAGRPGRARLPALRLAALGRRRGPASSRTARTAGPDPGRAARRTSRDCGRPVEVAIETKHPTRYAGLVERRLVERARPVRLGPPAARRLGAGPGHELLLAVAAADAGAGPEHPDRAPDGAGPAAAAGRDAAGAVRIAGPIDRRRPRAPAVRRAGAPRGGAVHVWTVDEPADVDLCLRAGRRRDHHQPAGRGAGAGESRACHPNGRGCAAVAVGHQVGDDGDTRPGRRPRHPRSAAEAEDRRRPTPWTFPSTRPACARHAGCSRPTQRRPASRSPTEPTRWSSCPSSSATRCGTPDRWRTGWCG